MAVAAPILDTSFHPHTEYPHTTLVEISVSCLGLKKMDLLSKSDPVVTLFARDIGTGKLTKLGQTEVIQNCSDPQFQKTFVLPYYFHVEQPIKFLVEDFDNAGIVL